MKYWALLWALFLLGGSVHAEDMHSAEFYVSALEQLLPEEAHGVISREEAESFQKKMGVSKYGLSPYPSGLKVCFGALQGVPVNGDIQRRLNEVFFNLYGSRVEGYGSSEMQLAILDFAKKKGLFGPEYLRAEIGGFSWPSYRKLQEIALSMNAADFTIAGHFIKHAKRKYEKDRRYDSKDIQALVQTLVRMEGGASIEDARVEAMILGFLYEVVQEDGKEDSRFVSSVSNGILREYRGLNGQNPGFWKFWKRRQSLGRSSVELLKHIVENEALIDGAQANAVDVLMHASYRSEELHRYARGIVRQYLKRLPKGSMPQFERHFTMAGAYPGDLDVGRAAMFTLSCEGLLKKAASRLLLPFQESLALRLTRKLGPPKLPAPAPAKLLNP